MNHAMIKAVVAGIGPEFAGHETRIKALEAENAALKAENLRMQVRQAEFGTELAAIKAEALAIKAAYERSAAYEPQYGGPAAARRLLS